MEGMKVEVQRWLVEAVVKLWLLERLRVEEGEEGWFLMKLFVLVSERIPCLNSPFFCYVKSVMMINMVN